MRILETLSYFACAYLLVALAMFLARCWLKQADEGVLRRAVRTLFVPLAMHAAVVAVVMGIADHPGFLSLLVVPLAYGTYVRHHVRKALGAHETFALVGTDVTVHATSLEIAVAHLARVHFLLTLLYAVFVWKGVHDVPDLMWPPKPEVWSPPPGARTLATYGEVELVQSALRAGAAPESRVDPHEVCRSLCEQEPRCISFRYNIECVLHE